MTTSPPGARSSGSTRVSSRSAMSLPPAMGRRR
jgi:hypothetical protein